MKQVLILILCAGVAWAGEKPAVDVYMIRKFDSKATAPELPEVILEVSNTTKKTVYVFGTSIEHPMFHVEAKRADRWLRIPYFLCGTGSSSYPLRPGTKMLVTVAFPLEETQARFRFFFFDSPDTSQAKVESVWSRGIDRKELGDLSGTIGETTSEKKLIQPETDDEMNKRSKPPESGPFEAPIQEKPAQAVDLNRLTAPQPEKKPTQ